MKSFADGRLGIVAQAAKIRHQFNRKVFVKLDLHIARIRPDVHWMTRYRYLGRLV